MPIAARHNISRLIAVTLLCAGTIRMRAGEVDTSTPKKALVAAVTATSNADVDAMKATITNVDPALLDAVAARISGLRAMQDAGVERWGRAGPIEPRIREGMLKSVNELPEPKVNGDSAVMGPWGGKMLKIIKVNDKWCVDGSTMMQPPAGMDAKTFAAGLKVQGRVATQAVQEIKEGKYRTWFIAQTVWQARVKEELKKEGLPPLEEYQPKLNPVAAPQAGAPPTPSPAGSDAKLKQIDDGWQSQGNAIDLLPRITGRDVAKNTDGVLKITRGGFIQTPDKFKPPVAFRIIALTDKKDVRLSYAANQIIFNWEMHPDELRIDGGPLAAKHKPGAGLLPSNEWVGIELIVHPDELMIYVDGHERYRADGDFSVVDQPLSFSAHRGDLWIKSLAVVK